MGRTANVASVAGAHGAPRERADSARNRERIIAAAREVFVASGPAAPLDEIARDAGVGNATLYRHFPDRDALVRGVVLAVTDRIAERGREALRQETDPFQALCRFVSGAVEERVGALCPVLSHRFAGADAESREARERLEGVTAELIARAHRSGQVRADVAGGDLMVVISQLTRPLPGMDRAAIGPFVQRHLRLFLDGLCARDCSQLPGEAATLETLRPPADR